MTVPLPGFVDSVNSRLDPRALLEAIGFRPDGISMVGGSIKAYCPVHRGEGFKSLQIDIKTRQCRCIVRGCGAAGGVGLVELFALANEIAPPPAAVRLVRTLALDPDGTLLEPVRRTALAHHDRARAAGDRRGALAALDLLAEMPAAEYDHVVWRIEAEADGADQPAPWIDALARLETAGQLDWAVRLATEQVLPRFPDDPAALAAVSRVQRARYPRGSSWAETAFARVQRLADTGDAATALAEIAELIKPLGRRADVRELHARLLTAAGRDDDAAREWWTAALIHEKEGAEDRALPLLEQLLAREPDDRQTREKAAELHARAGNVARYLAHTELLARAALAAGDYADCELCLRRMLARAPRHGAALIGMVDLRAAQGDRPAWALAALTAVPVLVESGDRDRADALLAEVRAGDFQGADHRMAMGTALLAVDDRAGGLAALLAAGDDYAEFGLLDEAIAAYTRAAGLSDDPQALRPALERLMDEGQAEATLAILRRDAEARRDAGRIVEALAVLDMAPALGLDGEALGDLRLGLLVQGGDRGAALAGVCAAAAERRAAADAAGEERLLRMGLGLFPHEPTLLTPLLELAEAAGDPAAVLAAARAIVVAPGIEPALRQQAAERAAAAPGTRPHGALLLGLARLHGGDPAGACDLFADLAGDVLARRAPDGGPLDPVAEYVSVLSAFWAAGRDDLATRLKGVLGEAVAANWSAAEQLANGLEAAGHEAAARRLVVQFAEVAIAAARHDDTLAATPWILARAPGEPRWIEARGRALAALGRPAEARAALAELVEGAVERGANREAVRLARLAVELLPGEAPLRRLLLDQLLAAGPAAEVPAEARALIQLHRQLDARADAVAVGRLVLGKHPAMDDIRRLLAEDLLALGRREAALTELRELAAATGPLSRDHARWALTRLHELLPADRAVLARLADVVGAADGIDAARPLREKLFAIDLAAADLHDAAARQSLAALVESDPAMVGPRAALAAALAAAGLVDEAAAAWIGLSRHQLESGQREESLATLVAAMAALTRHPTLMEEHARRLEQLDRRAEAAAAWAALIALGRGNAPDELLATAHVRRVRLGGEDPAALQAYAEFQEARGDNAEAIRLYHQLAELNDRLGRRADNVAILTRLVALDPRDIGAAARLADALAAAGSGEEALRRRLALVAQLRQRRDFGWALTIAMQARQDAPDSIEIGLALLDIHWEDNRTEALAAELVHLAGLHEAANLAGAWQELLATWCGRLAERKAHAAILAVIEGMPAALAGPESMRLRSLALEGAGRDREAAQCRVELAALEAAAGRAAEAERELRRAIALVPADRAIRRRLVEFLGAIPDRHDDLLSELHELARLSTAREAIGLLEEVLRLEPRDLVALRRLAALLRQEGSNELARARLMELAAAAREAGELPTAQAALAQAIEIDPTRLDANEALLDVLDAAGNLAEFSRAGCALADRVLRDGNRDAALRLYERVARRDRSNEESRRRLADHFLAIEYAAGAATMLRELHEIQMARADYAQATETLHRLQKIDQGDPRTLVLLGRLYALMHDAAQAAEHFRAAARAHAARGNLADAIAAAGESIALAPHHAGTVRLRAELLEKTGRPAEAAEDVAALLDMARREENIEDELDRLAWLVRLRPDDIASAERLANMYSDLDMAGEAARHFTAVARAREAAGQREAALDAASSAATLDPDSLAARILLARLLLATGQERRAREEALWVADRLEHDGDRTAARAFLADLCAQWTDPLVALRLAGIERADGDTAAAAARYRAVLGRRGIVLPEAAQLEALEGLLAAEPGDIEAQRQFQQLAAAQGATPRVAPLALAAVRHLAEAGEVEAARRFAEETEPRTEDPVRFLRECAGIYDQAGIPELAAGVYRSIARRLLPTNPRQALRDVNHCLELRPNDLTARELRLSILDAIGAGEEVLRASSELVTLYTQRGDEPRALELTRQMIRANPASIEARERFLALLPPDGTFTERLRMLDELASLYIQAGEAEAALDKLRELLRIDPHNREARLRYIDIYRQVGPESELAGDYLRLARAHEKAGDMMAAANTYERLIALAPAMEEAHRDFIRFLRDQGQGARLFAEVLSFAESLLRRDEHREAAAVLQQAANEGELDPAWHLLLGRAQLGTNARGAGARSLRNAAQLYRQARLHAEEAAALRELIRVDTYNLEARQHLIEALLSSGQLKDALAASEQLAHTYAERGLFDLAATEYRRLLAHERYQPAIWQQLFDAHLQIGREADLVPDFLDFADLLATRGDFPAAVGYYRRVIALDPTNIRAHRGLVIQYPKIGAERDIIDEILQLGRLLIDAGEVDEAARYFQLVMAIDPRNTRAREMMSATRGATGTASPTPSPAAPAAGSLPAGFLRGEDRLSETQKRFIYEKAHGASPVAAATPAPPVAPFAATSPEAALTQAVANYRNILLVNSANPAVRLKLADVLEQMGRQQEMLEELGTAAEQFFRKGEVAACIAACIRYLDRQPNDARIRRLLSEAEIKRDAIKALDSTISHLDFDTGELRRQSKDKT